MDWTLIRTKSGRQFPTNVNDWQLWHESVKPKLQSLHKEGYTIVVFTNQGGVATGSTKVADLKIKFAKIQEALDVPMIFLAAIGKNGICSYRKPSPSMYNHLESKLNGGIKFDSN